MGKPDRERSEKLVFEVEKRRCLYDPSHPDYKDRHQIDAAWAQVADALETTAYNARKRWQNLRGSFSKAVNTKPPCGTYASQKAPTFYLMDQMNFLRCFITRGAMIGNYGPESVEDTIPSADSEIEQLADAKDHSRSTSPLNTSSARSGSCKRKRPYSEDEVMIDFMNRREPDVDLMFFKGLLPYVKELTKRRKRDFFQMVTSELFKSINEQEAETQSEPVDTKVLIFNEKY
ncbi:uncharacterized protein LOC121373509 [Gigantopelta aegis]|uniref:uncharacterized protein LOC121373509 n=1 Tax=Gigantopelta aegis TaxID=1735272 RepID=UPI001B88A67D|nr:uncharacterized protein LOC121373509 [Gigantopelta aegis]